MRRLGSGADLTGGQSTRNRPACQHRRRAVAGLECGRGGSVADLHGACEEKAMRELKVVGLDADSKYLICESADPAEQFKLPADDRLRALLRDAATSPEQPHLE